MGRWVGSRFLCVDCCNSLGIVDPFGKKWQTTECQKIFLLAKISQTANCVVKKHPYFYCLVVITYRNVYLCRELFFLSGSLTEENQRLENTL